MSKRKTYYTMQELERLSIEAIKTHKLFFLNDIPVYLPISRTTFYDYELNKSDTIREALEQNRIEIKISMRNRWYNSNHPTLQILLYRLLADDEERRRIAQQYLEVSGGEIHASIDVTKLSDDTIRQIREAKSRPAQITDGE